VRLQPHEADDQPGSHTGHHNCQCGETHHCQTQKLAEKGPLPAPETFQWSWIGQRSPLMGPKSEPDWLLDKLFRKLEKSLRGELQISGGHKSDDHLSLFTGDERNNSARAPHVRSDSSSTQDVHPVTEKSNSNELT
jgi:hypothetical protein